MKRKAPLPCAFVFFMFSRPPATHRNRLALIAGISFFCLSACDSRSGHERYIEWVRDYEHGAHARLDADDFVFDLQYQPSEYVLLQRGMRNLPDSAEREELQKISGIQYYTLTIGVRNGNDLLAYHAGNAIEKQQRQYYFSYRFQDDIVLEENGKELPCVLYHFEKAVDGAKGSTFVLGFENKGENADEAKVVIRSELLGALPIRIKISKTNIPQVDL